MYAGRNIKRQFNGKNTRKERIAPPCDNKTAEINWRGFVMHAWLKMLFRWKVSSGAANVICWRWFVINNCAFKSSLFCLHQAFQLVMFRALWSFWWVFKNANNFWKRKKSYNMLLKSFGSKNGVHDSGNKLHSNEICDEVQCRREKTIKMRRNFLISPTEHIF